MVLNAKDATTRYSRTRAKLLAQLNQGYPEIVADPLFAEPHTGAVHVDNVKWNFRVHGRGVEFIASPPGLVLDVPLLAQQGFTAWEITVHLEFSGVSALSYKSVFYDVRGESTIASLLDALVADGVLRRNASGNYENPSTD